jgi:hypothetical protein
VAQNLCSRITSPSDGLRGPCLAPISLLAYM